MLGTLAATIALVQIAPQRMQSKDMWPWLAKLGFEAGPTYPQSPDFGTISSNGRKVNIFFRMRQSERRNLDTYVSAINLTYSYRPSKRVSPWYIKGWQEDHGMEEGQPVLITVGLDGSLRIRTTISTEFPLADGPLKSQIAGYFNTVERLQQDLPEAQADAPAFSLDENQKVDAIDSADAAYLINHWGWKYSGGFGGSGPTWVQPAWIEGTLFFIFPPHPGKLIRDGLVVSARYNLPKGADAEVRVKELQRKLPEMLVSNYGFAIGTAKEINLAGGITLKELKAQILNAAKKMAVYAKGKQGL